MNFVTDLDVKGKLVFLRVDFNVPLDESGAIRDDNRIKASLPTIQWLLEHGARLVIASHLGRPKGKPDPKMSLAPAAKRLAELIPYKVVMAPDVVGDEVARLKRDLREGEVLLLENVRFSKEEEKNDPGFAARLAEGIDIFVNDAFGSSHRAHASVVGIADHVPVTAAGYLMKKEVDYLKKAVHTPVKPYVAILGGAKVSDKIEIIESLLGKADHDPDRRGHGLHLPQGPGPRGRPVTRRGRPERGRPRHPRQGPGERGRLPSPPGPRPG